jgi:hypothetical protein
MRAAGNGGIACCNSKKGILLHRRAIEELDFAILQEINQIEKWTDRAAHAHGCHGVT